MKYYVLRNVTQDLYYNYDGDTDSQGLGDFKEAKLFESPEEAETIIKEMKADNYPHRTYYNRGTWDIMVVDVKMDVEKSSVMIKG